jgi:hypothetical protein
MKEGGLVLPPVVEQVGQVDAGLAMRGVELEGAAQPVEGAALVGEAVGGVAHARRRFGRVGVRRDGDLEEPAGLLQDALAEQRPADLEHQVVIVPEAEREDPLEAGHRAGAVSELEQGLAQSGEGVLVVGIEGQRLVERPPGPGVLFAGEAGEPHADVQLHRRRVEAEPLPEQIHRCVVLAVVVELMSAFVVVVGTQELIRHRTVSLEGCAMIRARWRLHKRPRARIFRRHAARARMAR